MPEAAERLGSFVRAGVRDPLILLVVGAYLAGFVLHAVSIWLLPLYLAQAAISLSMPCTAVLSVRQLHEPLGPGPLDRRGRGDPRHRAAGPRRRRPRSGHHQLGVRRLGAGRAGRWSPSAGFAARGSAPLLGALAGCGYAGSALAVRGIGAELSGPVLVCALAVPALGLVAFWLYSLALSRTGVAAATGALIVLQTFVPAAIGIAFLGDGVRDGWWPAIAAGLVLGVGGAVALSVPVAADDRMAA